MVRALGSNQRPACGLAIALLMISIVILLIITLFSITTSKTKVHNKYNSDWDRNTFEEKF